MRGDIWGGRKREGSLQEMRKNRRRPSQSCDGFMVLFLRIRCLFIYATLYAWHLSSRFTFLQTTAFWQVPLPVRPFLRNQPGQISQTLCCLIIGNSYTLGSCRTCCAGKTHPIPGSTTRHPGESLGALVFVSRLLGDERRLNVFLNGVNDLKEPGWLGGKVMESWLCRWVSIAKQCVSRC